MTWPDRDNANKYLIFSRRFLGFVVFEVGRHSTDARTNRDPRISADLMIVCDVTNIVTIGLHVKNAGTHRSE